jgi:hypothetical protein
MDFSPGNYSFRRRIWGLFVYSMQRMVSFLLIYILARNYDTTRPRNILCLKVIGGVDA